MQLNSLLEYLISELDRIGLDYSFLQSMYDREAWLSGIKITLELCAITLVLSLVFGFIFTLLQTSKNPLFSGLVRVFVEFTRNTPTLMQIYFAVLVLNMLINNHLANGAEGNPFTAYVWVILVLSLHYSAFHTEALRSGFEAVPEPMIESARSLGFSRWQLFLYIQFPIAFRFALPSLTNNLVNLIKSTSLGTAVAVGEVTYQSFMIWSQRDNVLELMILLLALYSALTYLLVFISRKIEHKLRMSDYVY